MRQQQTPNMLEIPFAKASKLITIQGAIKRQNKTLFILISSGIDGTNYRCCASKTGCCGWLRKYKRKCCYLPSHNAFAFRFCHLLVFRIPILICKRTNVEIFYINVATAPASKLCIHSKYKRSNRRVETTTKSKVDKW